MATVLIDKNVMVSMHEAINRIFHDAAHPSRLILPIIER
jgi:hypothetical protein